MEKRKTDASSPLLDDSTSIDTSVKSSTSQEGGRKARKNSRSVFSWGRKSSETLKEGLSRMRSSSLNEPSCDLVCGERPRAMSIVPDCCTNSKNVTVDDVVLASYRIRDEIKLTPCEKAGRIYEISEYDVYFKREYLQISGSYKTRGALNALMTLARPDQIRGVLGTSASSHAIALAIHGKKFGIPVTILAAENIHPRKMTLYNKHDAKLMFVGKDDNEVFENIQKANVNGLKFIDEQEDPYVISGIGTIFLEIVKQLDNIDAIILPVGGGTMLAAACVVIKSLFPQIKVIGVESANCPSFKASLKAGRPVIVKANKGSTFFDGFSTQKIGQLPFHLAKYRVDKVVTVREDQIGQAVLRLIEKEKAIVEGAGAAGLAALIGGYLPELKGKRVVIPLCGGNIEPTVLGRAIERGLTADGRMVRFIVKIGDRPGSLARLTTLIASTGVSVKDLNQERTWLNSSIFSIQVKCVAEMRNAEHGETLRRLLETHYKDDFTWNQTAEE